MKAKSAAKLLQSMGQGDDTILAHITPEEAGVLKAGGGSGKPNPKTGLLAFGGYEGGGTDMSGGYEGGFEANDLAQFGTAAAPLSLSTGAVSSAWGDQLAAAQEQARQQLAMISSGASMLLGPVLGTAVKGAHSAYGTDLANSMGYNNAMRDAAIAQGWGAGAMPGNATAESNYGDGYGAGGMGGLANPAAAGLLSTAPVEQPTYTQPAFVSKWGKPRSGFTDPYARNRRGLLGG